MTRAIENDRPLPLRVIPGGLGSGAFRSGIASGSSRPEGSAAVDDRGAFARAGNSRGPVHTGGVGCRSGGVGCAGGACGAGESRADSRGEGTRLASHLSPRSRLDLSWRVEAEPGAQLSPLLSIQGDIAIDVDPGAFRARSSWAIKSVRGRCGTLAPPGSRRRGSRSDARWPVDSGRDRAGWSRAAGCRSR